MADVYSVSGTQLANVLKEHWLAVAKERLSQPSGLFKALPVDPFAERSGTTVNISRYAELPDNDDPISNEYTRPYYRALKTGKVTASIVTLMDNVAVSEIAQLTSLDGAETVPNLIVSQGKRSVERYLAKNITAYMRLIRADLDANYQYTGAADSDGAADGTTLVDSDRGADADDYWNGALLTLIDEEFNVLESRYVTDFTTSTGTFTFGTAFSYQILDGTRYHVCHFTGITTGDILTISNLREAQILMHGTGHYGPEFEIGGGGYAFVLDAFNFGDMLADSNIINLFIQKEKESGMREYGWGGKLLSLDPVQTARPFRCAVGGAGTYARTGVCDIALLLGKTAASRMPLEKSDIQVIIKDKTEGGHANPGELYSTFTWKHKLAAAKHDCSGAVGIICYQGRSN